MNLNRQLDAVEWRIRPALTPYPEAVAFMEERVEAIRRGAAPETVWLIEHPPLYTAGTSARPEELRDADRLPEFASGRGGQYTYHGPGQRVAYLMLDLGRRDRDLRRFVWTVEEWVIRALAPFGVRGERRAGRIGVWVRRSRGRGDDKIAAIGLRVRHWITYHGVAINVAPNLDHYAGIVPCGIVDAGVTSMAALGVEASIAELDRSLRRQFPGVFGAETVDAPAPSATPGGVTRRAAPRGSSR